MLFAMRHAANAERLPQWDGDTAQQVLAEAARLAASEIAPLDVIADRTGARIVDGRALLPEPFHTAYRKYRDGGWPGIACPEQYGGSGMPHVMAAAVAEMLAGACVSFQMITGLAQGAVRCIAANGSEAQRDRYLPPLVSGEWLATMCLTEPQAGSDLAGIRSLATPRGDGRYRLNGTKIFISGGDHDLTKNILHVVLARTPGAAQGTRGLSVFLCPAMLEDGRRNGVRCVRLEEKMGMHASPTCQLVFEEAEAELLGAEGEGLRRMFVMMNVARLDTALQAVGLGEVAGQRSRAYAEERRQGRGAGGEPGPIKINRHPDVQRMLLTQIALVEGCRGLLYRVCVERDLNGNSDLVDFLTPLCKAFATDAAIETAQLAIQIHGGYGYLREYRVEQVLRDARVTAIYEGTNGIQAITLADRVLKRGGGAAAAAFRREIEQALSVAGSETGRVMRHALERWEAASTALVARAAAGAAATSYLRLSGLVGLGAVWGRMEAAAAEAPNPHRTLTAAAFFRDWLLPEADLQAERVIRELDWRGLRGDALKPD
jgi:hypothetical protein